MGWMELYTEARIVRTPPNPFGITYKECSMESRHIALAVASSLALMLAAQPANADPMKTGANAKDNVTANTCVDDCLAKGYEWARANAATDDDQCDTKSDDFEHGCSNYINDQEDAAHAAKESAEDASHAAKESAEDADKAAHEAAESTEDAADEAAEGDAAKPPGN